MRYFQSFSIILTLFFLPFQSIAQDESNHNEEHRIKLLINKLFDGMREGDSATVSSVFHKDVNMYTSYTNQQGLKVIKKGALESFLQAIGTPHDEIWDEKIWNTKIEIDGSIAQVWTDYAFFVGSEFSHCGIDAFHLIKDNKQGWKIVHLMDTRRKSGCELPNNLN